MPTSVMLMVLFGALLHASWNALIKASEDKLLDMTWVVIGAGLLSAVAAVFLPAPAPASWPQLAASTVLHAAYFLLVALAYRSGDLSVAYPVMRGAPPLITACAAALLFGEPLSAIGWTAVLLLVCGVMTLAGDGLRVRSAGGRGLALIGANVLVIVAYTLLDGSGVRASGNAASYVCWLFLLTGAAVWPLSRRWRRGAPTGSASRRARIAVGAACTLGAYGITLWAMTRAPIGLVAALRETSILFAALLAALVLKEPFSRRRWSAVAIITAGTMAVRAA